MPTTDGCLFTGPCPFRALRDAEAPGRLLARLGVGSGGFVSFPSLFYHTPQAGLAQTEAALALEGPGVWLHGTTHPLRNERAQPHWGQPGSRVRTLLLAPDLHHYPLEEPRVARVVEHAAQAGLPVVLLRRVGDRRLAPDWLALEETPLERLCQWVQSAPPCRLVISQLTPHEAATLADECASRPGLYLELGGFAGPEGSFAELLARGDFTRWLYGSGAPLHYALGNRHALAEAAGGFARFNTHAQEVYGS